MGRKLLNIAWITSEIWSIEGIYYEKNQELFTVKLSAIVNKIKIFSWQSKNHKRKEQKKRKKLVKVVCVHKQIIISDKNTNYNLLSEILLFSTKYYLQWKHTMIRDCIIKPWQHYYVESLSIWRNVFVLMQYLLQMWSDWRKEKFWTQKRRFRNCKEQILR